jgi:RNA polymerase sigma-70 factor (ECF subfamily)
VLASEVDRLHGALDTLPHDQRQASSMAYFSGLTHLEIATRTVAPLGTVKRRVRLGLRQLRDSLEDSGAPLLRSCNQSETM